MEDAGKHENHAHDDGDDDDEMAMMMTLMSNVVTVSSLGYVILVIAIILHILALVTVALSRTGKIAQRIIYLNLCTCEIYIAFFQIYNWWAIRNGLEMEMSEEGEEPGYWHTWFETPFIFWQLGPLATWYMLMIFMLMDRLLSVAMFPTYGDQFTGIWKIVVCAISWIWPFIIALVCTIMKSWKHLKFSEIMSAIYIIRLLVNVSIILLVIISYSYFAFIIARRLKQRVSATKQILAPGLIILTFAMFVLAPDVLLFYEHEIGNTDNFEEETMMAILLPFPMLIMMLYSLCLLSDGIIILLCNRNIRQEMMARVCGCKKSTKVSSIRKGQDNADEITEVA